MHELLNNYITKKEQEQKEYLNKQKNDFLISQGLFQKEYSGKDTYDPDYPFDEWNSETHQHKFYKNVAINVTDDEYKKILELSKSTNKEKPKRNTIALVLDLIAWLIFAGGFIMGIIFGNIEITKGTYYTYTVNEFSLAIAFTYWAVSLISGAMFLGIAEIIKLLNDIKNK